MVLYQHKILGDGATFFTIRSSEFLLINPVLVFLVNRVPHIPCCGVLGLDVAHEILEIQLRMRIIVQLAAKTEKNRRRQKKSTSCW